MPLFSMQPEFRGRQVIYRPAGQPEIPSVVFSFWIPFDFNDFEDHYGIPDRVVTIGSMRIEWIMEIMRIVDNWRFV